MRRKCQLFIIAAAVFGSLYVATCCEGAGGDRVSARRDRGTPGKAAQPTGPLLGVEMKDAPSQWGIEGALICNVIVDLPADRAGIVIGDIVTEINAQPTKTAADLRTIVSGLTANQPYKVTVRRGRQSLTMDITLMDSAASADLLTPAKRCLMDINILKYAIIDPQSRVITLVGKYDPNYKTGPIPYYDLLNDALHSPYPWFSLEPSSETRAGIAKINDAIGADVQRMYSEPEYCVTWANRLQNLLLNDPSLMRDRARFIKKGADAFGITEGEMLKVLAKSLNPAGASEDEMIPILGKVLQGLGYDQVGAALLGQQDGSTATCLRLGISTEANAIVAKFKSGELTKERATVELGVLIESAILRGLRVPEADVNSRASMVLEGRMSLEDFQKYMEDRLMAIVVDSAGLKMFHGLMLSHELLSKLYNVPTPRMNLVFRDVPADSLLGDILFRADYVLKSVCTNPDVKQIIPNFLTEMDYTYDIAVQKGTRIPGDAGAEVGHQLTPGEVKMRVSPSGTLVAFDDAQIKIIGWVIQTVGKRCTPEVAELMKSSAEDYGGYLTQHYDELARVYGELHRIREAEKLIALARWAKSNNYNIVVDKATGIRLSQVPSAVGFWLAVFTADPQEFSLSVIAEGGAVFDQEKGEAWIKPTIDSEVTADVSKQLVMSAVLAQQAADAALRGNMESARDLADKSARAMTGDIDLTQLPSLGDLPMPGEPAQTVVLSTEALSAIDQNLTQIDKAKVAMQKVSDMETSSPQDAAKLREMAEAQKRQAEANLQSLRDALDSARKDPGKTNDAVVTIRGLGKVTSPSATVATNPQPNPGNTIAAGGQSAPATPQPALKDDITPEQRAKLLAELASLEMELQATKDQFGKLSKAVQDDRKSFDDWEKVAKDGKERCSGFLYNLLMDATVSPLSDRYKTMRELAEKLPNKPPDLIGKLGRIENWLKATSTTQAFKDVSDIAARDGKTLPELLEEVRDDLNIIAAVTGLDKTFVGAWWKFGCSATEIAYSYAQFSCAYDNIELLDKNSEGYLKAVAALTVRMQTLVKRIGDVKNDLGAQPSHR